MVRDENNHVNLTKVKVQMDCEVASHLNAMTKGGSLKLNFQPQDGKFMDVYCDEDKENLVVIGVTAQGCLWKKELDKGFFEIFDN